MERSDGEVLVRTLRCGGEEEEKGPDVRLRGSWTSTQLSPGKG